MAVSERYRSRQAKIAGDRWAIFTHISFGLMLALVVARCTMSESVREPFQVMPGAHTGPHGAGPAGSMALDLFCCVPAILILLRRVLDKSYVLRWTWSQVLLLPLAIWMAMSVRRSDDEFGALIGVANFVAALAILWAAAQLVRSWLRLRLVAAVAFGLLMILLAQGVYYRAIELPDLQQTFEKNSEQYLRDFGYTPGSFAARQFQQKITSGEMIGFNASTNSFAAVLLLLSIVGAGAAIQRVVDRDAGGWVAAIGLVMVPVVILLLDTKSKAALVSPILAAGMLAGIWRWRDLLARYSRRAFWVGVATVALVFAAVIGHGLYHHGLPTASLNFRWRYWVASWRMFWRHPIAGIGWSNFAEHYLRDRLPAAAEEIRDPHNFIVRFFVELGCIGGILLLAWMGRLWWEITRPNIPLYTPAEPAPRFRADESANANFGKSLLWLLAIGGGGIAISVLLNLDFNAGADYVVIEMIKRLLFLCAFMAGAIFISLQSLQKPEFDARPAPWILYAVLVGCGVFLIHNLIDFSMFEPGMLALFCLLIGSVLGVRHPSMIGKRRAPVVIPAAWLALVVAGCVAVVVGIAIPVARAESAANAGDAALRGNDAIAAGNLLDSAWHLMPANADYEFRAARAYEWKNGPTPLELAQTVTWLSLAINGDRSNVGYYLNRAELEMRLGNRNGAVEDFSRAIDLNPNDVAIRLQYAAALEKLGMFENARDEYQEALRYNDLLDATEPKRLSPEQVAGIQEKIRANEFN